MEEWKFHRTLSGSPQGGIVSPILANIYLDKLDQFVNEKLLPDFNCGEPPPCQSGICATPGTQTTDGKAGAP